MNATQAELDARDAGILRQMRAMAEVITGQRNGGDLWEHLEEIHDRVKRGDWTVGDARKTLGLDDS